MGTATKIADREQRGATMSDRICSVPEQGGLDHAEALAGAGYEIAVP